MITLNRKTTLNWVLDPSAFESINTKALVVLARPLGTSVSAVSKMLAQGEEMEMLLPDVLGMSPEANSTDWHKHVSNYWHNFYLEVPTGGQVFNNTLVLDVHSSRHSKRDMYLAELAKRLGIKDYKSEEGELALYKHITDSKFEETQRYKYMYAENIEDYLAWRYCLLSSKVANEPDLISKSTNIDFYLIDEGKIAKRAEKLSKLKTDAIDAYYKLTTTANSDGVIENLLIGYDIVRSLKDLKELSSGTRKVKLLDEATTNPEKFLAMVSDKLVESKAEIKKLVLANLIKQIPNSSIYVDVTDPSIVLGQTLSDVITFMNTEVNAAYVNELRLKFKGQNN